MVEETRRSLRVTAAPQEEKPANIPQFNHNRSRSLPLQKNSDLKTLHWATDSCIILRGPRYDAYSKLRQSKLQMRHAIPEDEQVGGGKQSRGIDVPKPDSTPSPINKSVRFQGHQFRPKQNRSSSVGSSGLAQSVPDFSVMLRKENRRPAVNRVEKLGTLPPRASKVQGSASKLFLGSKAVNYGDMKGVSGGCGVMGRREMRRMSYSGVEGVRSLSAAVGSATAISRENRGGRYGRSSIKWV